MRSFILFKPECAVSAVIYILGNKAVIVGCVMVSHFVCFVGLVNNPKALVVGWSVAYMS